MGRTLSPVPLDYHLGSSLFRVLTKTGGAWADDPDILDPAVALPATITSDDPATRLACRMPDRRTSKVKLKVTFRDAEGLEVAGTYDASAFTLVPLCDEEKALGATRPAIERNGAPVTGTSAEFQVIDELGINDIFGVIYSNISADATHMFVRIEEVG